ncbi:hypothetical protein EH228_13085 [Erwinia endophytica]|uniref:hypothetical protein n=1 Tax=Erwinia endophytica TaxID=1563158 RepID=UPI001265E3B5|nr:hypothetical protein [Erwinia endophytica]KAB8309467.1 hypothetical protein EH228_13085 [Erwinia endophytica]
MKKVILLLLATLATTVAAYAESDSDDPAQGYIANLCTIVTQEKSLSSADNYIAQLKTLDARTPSPSAQEKNEFDEDEARTIVAAWMNLSEDQQKEARQNQEACQNAILNEYQSQD